jgi:hypothetical protein
MKQNNMTEEFIPYQQALALKELGFDEPCFAFYLAGSVRYKEYKDSQNKNSAFYNNTVCSAPLYQQAFRWLREKYDFHVTIQRSKKYVAIVYESVNNFSIDEYETYEEAELACLIKLIQILNQKL